MEKVVSFDSSREHYDAEACVVWCFDDRFFKLLDAFIKGQGWKKVDVVKAAGGAKALTDDKSPDYVFVMNQIKASVRLHKTKRLALMVHIDCGGYGGSVAFSNDRQAEIDHHTKELEKVRTLMNRDFPELSTDFFIADFDGLYQV